MSVAWRVQGPAGHGDATALVRRGGRATVHELLGVLARHALEPSAGPRARAEGMTLCELRDELLGQASPRLDAAAVTALRARGWRRAFPRARLVAAVASDAGALGPGARPPGAAAEASGASGMLCGAARMYRCACMHNERRAGGAVAVAALPTRITAFVVSYHNSQKGSLRQCTPPLRRSAI